MVKEKGFTLIELMIVVAIIAILAAIAMPAFGQQVKKTKDGKALNMLGAMRSQVSLVQSDFGGYAPSAPNIILIMTSAGTYTESGCAGEQARLIPIQGFAKAHTDRVGINSTLIAGTPTTGISWSYSVDAGNDGWQLACTATSDTKRNDWSKY